MVSAPRLMNDNSICDYRRVLLKITVGLFFKLDNWLHRSHNGPQQHKELFQLQMTVLTTHHLPKFKLARNESPVIYKSTFGQAKG